jgi:hypothetical protein
MDPEIKATLAEQQIKIDAILQSVEKTRKYFQMITWITIITLVLPMIGLMLFGPSIMSGYVEQLNGIESQTSEY